MKDCKLSGNCSICCCEKVPSLFKNLSGADFEALHFQRKEVVFKAGEVIFKQGTALTHFACFREGFVKVYVERPEGSNILINILHPGRFSASMGFYTDNIHHLTVQALTEVRLCLISTKDLESVLEKNTAMAIELLALKNKSIINLTNKLANLTYKSMAGRVADVLLYLQNDVYGSDTFVLNLTRQDLADLAAMTKESFIRSLKELKDSGIISIVKAEVKILNQNALKKISNS